MRLKLRKREAPPPEPDEDSFDWVHFAQTEIKHLQVLELLEGALAEAEQVVKEMRSRALGGALLAFSSASRRAADQRERSEAALAGILRRIHEERRALEANEHSLHVALHEWLLLNDPRYAVSAELDLLFEQIDASLVPISEQLSTLLSKYGAARNEIAVSFDHGTGSLSPAGMASLERLIASYDELLESERRLALRLDRVNAIVAGTMFDGLRLCAFDQALPPDCRREMDYKTLQANFEAGAMQVRSALEQMCEYSGAIRADNEKKDRILFDYRETKWQSHLASMRASVEGDAAA